MKVKFLRRYGKNEIGTEKVINVDEQERAYLLSTGTIEILEDDVEDDVVEDKKDTQKEDDIPQVPVDEENSEEESQEPPKDEEKAGKNEKKGRSK